MITKIISEIENQYIRKWTGQGKKVVGYSCVYTPTEILEAAGILPFRIRGFGSNRTDQADARLSRYNCSFCRSCLQLGLEGKFDFFDGIIETNGCDQLRGMFENWQYAKPLPFFHYLKVPHIITAESMDFFTKEIRRYKNEVQEGFGVKISDDQVWDAIERQIRIRQTLHQIFTLRERKEPAITGEKALEIVLAGGSMPAKDYEELIQNFLAENKNNFVKAPKARLLFGGSATDELDIVKTIEQLGGLVVADSLCFSSRAFWPLVKKKGKDPYRFLAEQYLGHSICPRMYDEFNLRFDYVIEAVKRAHVDGIILVYNKFCDVHGVDNVLLRIKLEEKGIPVILLEKEYAAAADLGRMKTRVQAFLERITL